MLVNGGDGVNEDSIRGMLNILERYKYSADNVSFGIGGARLQRCDRDTQRFAMKASELVVDGVRRAISKDPVSDPGKRSKSGRWELYKVDGQYVSALTGAEKNRQPQTRAPAGELLSRWAGSARRFVRRYEKEKLTPSISDPANSIDSLGPTLQARLLLRSSLRDCSFSFSLSATKNLLSKTNSESICDTC